MTSFVKSMEARMVEFLFQFAVILGGTVASILAVTNIVEEAL